MKKKLRSMILFCVLILFFLILFIVIEKNDAGESNDIQTEKKEATSISIDKIDFERIDSKKIQIIWLNDYDEFVDTYIIKKRDVLKSQGVSEWKTIAKIKSDENEDKNSWTFTDELSDATPKQYEYRIDVELRDNGNETELYAPAEGKTILTSNIKVCIDPGHYDIAREVAEADDYHYVEGNIMLELGLELKQVLKESYGIDASMTRNSGKITLEGYTNEELDSSHISLRGAFSAEENCDLFVSLHTNSNAENANNYPTYFQPIEINKPIILVNSIAGASESAMKIANSIGENLAEVNYRIGLSKTAEFKKVNIDEIEEWSIDYNDALNETGTVLCRTGSKGDYYGVLRGASEVLVPGMIIEHGFHSVPEVRKFAVESNLKEEWAMADANGIACGFGFE